MSAGSSSAHSSVHGGTPQREVVPYVIVSVVALALAAVSWTYAFRNQPTSFPVSCGLAAAGTPVASTSLVGEAAVPPSEVRVRVYNANGQVGQATTVSEQLRTLSFVPDDEIPFGNDPLVESQDLGCFGQLRFGPDFNGQAAALHALFPCFELIHDARTDPSVDVSLGEGFEELSIDSQVKETVAALNDGDQAALDQLAALQAGACS